MFVRNAAKTSYEQLLVRQSLEGMPVSRFMNPSVVAVTPDMTIGRVVEDYLYTYHYRMFPVIDGDRLAGCVSVRQIKAVPQEEWQTRTVASIVSSPAARGTPWLPARTQWKCSA